MRNVALLRGINLGSKNRVSMSHLRDLVGGLGYGDVETLVQSGNVVFSDDDPADVAAGRIEKALRKETGLDVGVIGRSAAELAAVVQQSPYAAALDDPRYHHVVFLDRAPDAGLAAAIDRERYLPETFAVHGREVYVLYPNGAGRAKLTHGFWEKRLGARATARNWNTVQRLAEMTSA
jgi:uncharacterized protein (DUF1697 family)